MPESLPATVCSPFVGWLFFLFLAIPLAEIALFIVVGERIGVWTTVGLVALTAFVGAYLVSSQGRGVIRRITTVFRSGAFPGAELAHGAMVLFGGALLLTPGFLTDALGLALMVPAVREALRRWGARRYRNRIEIIDL